MRPEEDDLEGMDRFFFSWKDWYNDFIIFSLYFVHYWIPKERLNINLIKMHH